MKRIEPPDSHRVSAAQGWIELGNTAEAESELAAIDARWATHPLVLETWWLLHARSQDWQAGLQVAEQECQVHPDSPAGWLHRAYAVRRLPTGGLAAAASVLRPARERFPDEPTIPYNLACYDCQLGRMEHARDWLAQAMATGGKARIRQMALEDPDLEALWPELR